MISSPSISALTAGNSFSAATAAFTKKLMKPSFWPCRFSNASLYSARSPITAPISTSLKVVSIAAVFCASFRRRAMVWRRRVIFTRSSPPSSGRAEALAAGAAAAATGFARKACTSPFVTRPSLPLPAPICAGVTPASAIALVAAGPFGRVAAGALAGASAAGAGFAAGAGAAAGFAAAAPAAMVPSRAPAVTSAPSCAAMDSITPAAGALTSTVTLSVSSSTSGSSAATASPAFFSQRATVALETLSPSGGTMIPVILVPS